MRFFLTVIFLIGLSLSAYAEKVGIISYVSFPEYLKKEIISQSQEVCSVSNCTVVVAKLLNSLGYEVQVEGNSVKIVKNLRIKSVAINGLPEFMLKEREVIKNFLLNQIYSPDLVENAKLLLLFKLRSAGFKDVTIDVLPRETSAGYKIVFNIDKGLPYIITKVSIECENYELKKFAEKFLSNEIGKRFDQERIFKVVKEIESKFLDLGYYNIEISYSWEILGKRRDKKEAVLILKINPGKRYIVKIKGNKSIPKKKIIKAITFKQDKAFDEFEIERSVQNIEKLYKDKGFPYVKVKVEVKPINKEVNFVYFLIDEGPKVKVKRVELYLRGYLEKKDREKVFSILKTLRYSFYSQKKIDERISDVKFYLKSKGYFGISLKYELKNRTLLFSLAVEGKKIIREISGLPKEISEEFKVPSPYTSEFDTKLKMRVLEFYTTRGFFDAKVSIFRKEFKFKNTIYIDFRVEVDKGKRYRVGFVLFSGLKRTKIGAIKPIVVVKPGNFYSRNSIIEQYSLLSRMQIFTMIDLKQIKVSNEKIVNPVFDLVEAPLLRAKGFIGYSSDAGISLKSSGSSSSPFGRGFYFFLLGEYRHNEGSNILFKVGKSGIFGKRNRGYLTLIRKREIFESFDVVRYITRVEISRRQWGKIIQNYGLELAREIVTSEDMGEETFYKKTFYITSDFDWRNSFTNPVKGHRIYNKLAYTGGLLGGDASYFLFELKGLKLKPFFKNKLIAALRIGTGYIKPLKENGVPIQDKFYLGGAESVRGYRYGTISPVDSDGNYIGGDFYSLFSFELRYNFLSSVQLATFYDAGQVFPEIGDFTFNNWYSSVGIGFRYLTPVGPLRVDYGYKLKKIPGQGPGRFHISFGFPF